MPFEVVETPFPFQFRIRYPNGELSEDFYNKTRAVEFCKKMNNGEENPKIGYEPIGGRTMEPFPSLKEARIALGKAVQKKKTKR